MSKFDNYSAAWFSLKNFDDLACITGTVRNNSNYGTAYNMISAISELLRSSAPVFNKRMGRYDITVPKADNRLVATLTSFYAQYFFNSSSYGGIYTDYEYGITTEQPSGTQYFFNSQSTRDLTQDMEKVNRAEMTNIGSLPTTQAVSAPNPAIYQNAGKVEILQTYVANEDYVISFTKALARAERRNREIPPGLLAKVRAILLAPNPPPPAIVNQDLITSNNLSDFKLADGSFAKLSSSISFDVANCLPYCRLTQAGRPIFPGNPITILRTIFRIPNVLQEPTEEESLQYFTTKTTEATVFVRDSQTDSMTDQAKILDNRSEAGSGGALAALNSDSKFLKVLDTVVGMVPVIGGMNERLTEPAKIVGQVGRLGIGAIKNKRGRRRGR